MSVRYVLTVTCLVACGRVGFDAHTDGGGGSGGGDGGGSSNDAMEMPGDAMGMDSGIGTCANAIPATTFPGGFPCTNWGGNAQQINAGMSESNGTLTLTPNANTSGASAACSRSNVTIGAAGAFTEVSQVLSGTTSRTRLEIDWGGFTYFIGAEDGIMMAGRTGVTLTGGPVQRWWRFRPVGNELWFEASPDGAAWNRFASMGNVPTGIATLRVIATTPMPEAAPGMARFESVNVCP